MMQATLDVPVTDKELDSMHGVPKTYTVSDLIIEALTQTILHAPNATIGLPYVKYAEHGPRLAMYALTEVITDYGTEPEPLEALMAVLAKSTCPLVSAYRMAIAESYRDKWADAIEEFGA